MQRDGDRAEPASPREHWTTGNPKIADTSTRYPVKRGGMHDAEAGTPAERKAKAYNAGAFHAKLNFQVSK